LRRKAIHYEEQHEERKAEEPVNVSCRFPLVFWNVRGNPILTAAALQNARGISRGEKAGQSEEALLILIAEYWNFLRVFSELSNTLVQVDQRCLGCSDHYI
jgi:hypothetical protein